jgi:hypothetical protein
MATSTAAGPEIVACSAIIKATRPTDPAAAAGPATVHRELPVVQSGRC